MTQDPDLSAALTAAPDPQARSALLNLDYDRLVETRKRLVIGTSVLAFVPMVTALVVGLNTVGGSALDHLPAVVIGTVTGMLCFTIALIVMSIGARRLLELPILRQQLVAGGLQTLLAWSLLFAAIVAFGQISSAHVLGLLCGALGAATISIIGVASLPDAIRLNSPTLESLVAQLRQLPEQFTLLGGRVRWLLMDVAARQVATTGAVLLLWMSPQAFTPAVAVVVVADLAAMTLSLRRHPGLAIVVTAISAIALVVAALLLAR